VFEGHAQLLGATWAFVPETAAHALRIVHSGLLDRLPALTIVLGHLGETLPYFAWRIQHCFEYSPSNKRLERQLQDYLSDNFYVSTSGHLSDQALISAILTIGADRILLAVDYPLRDYDACPRVDRAGTDPQAGAGAPRSIWPRPSARTCPTSPRRRRPVSLPCPPAIGGTCLLARECHSN
jgi:predicted TIM-barrel fold metal-dependent hydrolase